MLGLKQQQLLLQDNHEDFDHEVSYSIIDTSSVEEQRKTLEETW